MNNVEDLRSIFTRKMKLKSNKELETNTFKMTHQIMNAIICKAVIVSMNNGGGQQL